MGSLKGCDKSHDVARRSVLSHPFRVKRESDGKEPRALPQASLSQPFRLVSHKGASTFHISLHLK